MPLTKKKNTCKKPKQKKKKEQTNKQKDQLFSYRTVKSESKPTLFRAKFLQEFALGGIPSEGTKN